METITCKLVQTSLDQPRKSEKWGPFKFLDTLETLPYEIDKGVNYIIVSWNSNTYITGEADNSFKINEHHGEKLMLDKEYLLIRPIY